MRKIVFALFTLLILHSSLSSNPVDNTPIIKFSELVFDGNNNWTMEISFPFGYSSNIDSVVFCVSNQKAKLAHSYPDKHEQIALITSDSLTTPLFIDREGDKIVICTYSKIIIDSTTIIRQDSIIFGDKTGATVGQPISDYSILRKSWRYSAITFTIDCLTKHPSLGALNDTIGLSATLKGYIYDADGKVVTERKKIGVGGIPYFVLETPLSIDSTGEYKTQIFPTLCSPTKLIVRFENWTDWKDYVEIEPFELTNIHPDTVVIQNIHLKDNRYVTSVNTESSIPNDELKLINYPNPFNLSTNFFVKIPDRLRGKPGNIDIFNSIGQLIRIIEIKDGITASWDGKDADNTIMPSGVYFYKLTINTHVIKTGSMVLLK